MLSRAFSVTFQTFIELTYCVSAYIEVTKADTFLPFNTKLKPEVVVHTWNPNTQEAEAGK